VAEARQRRRSYGSALDVSDNVPDAADDLKEATQSRQRLTQFAELPDDAAMSGGDAVEVLDDLADAARVDLFAEDFPSPPGVSEDVLWEAHVGWTAGTVRAVLAEIAERAESEPAAVLAEAMSKAELNVFMREEEARQLQSELDQYRRTHTLPDGEILDRVNRYETTLERSLFRTLHELQRMQAVRDGHVVPVPVALDVDVSGGRD
jgi:hypothetical protein